MAIADVSHYVRPGDALDQDARERGTSVYFPRRVIPMLPEKLSNGLCSLNPNVERLAMVCEMAITPQGEVERYEFYAAVFRSRARLTYTEVWAKLSGGKAPPELQTLYDLFHALHGERTRRGAIDFDTVETRMVFDSQGKIEKIVPEPRNDAHRIIEECMLAANVSRGQFPRQPQAAGALSRARRAGRRQGRWRCASSSPSSASTCPAAKCRGPRTTPS